MKLAALFSGGKDSVMAIDWLEQRGHDVVCLLTMISERDDSYMFHVPNVEWTEEQAKALRLPLLTKKTSGVKEEELKDLRDILRQAQKEYKIKGVSAGALASRYQRDRVITICKELGLVPFTPYWNYGDDEYMKQMIDSGYKVIMVGAFADGLTKKHLGRIFDDKFLEELREIKKKTQIHLAGEGGEYESFVLDGPIFRQSLVIEESEIIEKEGTAVLQIKKISLKDKEIKE